MRQRLLNLSTVRQDNFNRLLTQYALERLLYRISRSPHSEHFILKGAMLFLLWMEEPHRHTRDLDLLGTGDPAPERLTALFQEICILEVAEDGMVFDPTTVTAKNIREENMYGGVRVRLTAFLEKARIPLQIDVGYGDAVTPDPEAMTFPTLLDFPPPLLRAYARETVIAEKLSALITLDMDNSRMKDFFDLWILTKQFGFEGEQLGQAVVATFARRSLRLPEGTPTGLSETFWGSPAKQVQWRTFVRQSVSPSLQTLTLEEVIDFIASFLSLPFCCRFWTR